MPFFRGRNLGVLLRTLSVIRRFVQLNGLLLHLDHLILLLRLRITDILRSTRFPSHLNLLDLLFRDTFGAAFSRLLVLIRARVVFMLDLDLLEHRSFLGIYILRSQLHYWLRLPLLWLPTFIHFLLLLRTEVVVLDLLCLDLFIWLLPLLILFLFILLILRLIQTSLHDHLPRRPVLLNLIDSPSVSPILTDRFPL